MRWGTLAVHATRRTLTLARKARAVYALVERDRYGDLALEVGMASYHGMSSDGSGPLIASCGSDPSVRVSFGGWSVQPQWSVFGSHHSIGLGRLWIDIQGGG